MEEHANSNSYKVRKKHCRLEGSMAPAILTAILLLFLLKKEFLYQKCRGACHKYIGYDALYIHLL
jgi:hypothetical protein